MIWTYLFIFSGISLAVAQGAIHAVLWSKRGHEAFSWNEHIIFNIERGALVLLLLSAHYIESNLGWLIVAATFTYPFFHNGSYYTFRDIIDGSYRRRFFAYSRDSSAVVNFTLKQRTVLSLISVVILVFFVF